MLMMLAPRFAKSGQSFGRIAAPAVDMNTGDRRGNLKGNPADAAPRFAKSGQSFGRIAAPAVDSNTRRSARESERKPS